MSGNDHSHKVVQNQKCPVRAIGIERRRIEVRVVDRDQNLVLFVEKTSSRSFHAWYEIGIANSDSEGSSGAGRPIDGKSKVGATRCKVGCKVVDGRSFKPHAPQQHETALAYEGTTHQ